MKLVVLTVCLLMAPIVGAQAADRWDITGGTDYGGTAPTSYYWQGDYGSETAGSQVYETLGPDYGPDGVKPSTNADGFLFTPYPRWVPGQSIDVTWILNQKQAIGNYGLGEYVNLWKDLDQNGTWEDDEIIFSDHRSPGDPGWTDLSPGLKYFTSSFIDPRTYIDDASGAELLTPYGWTWLHARLSYSIDVTDSPSFQAVTWTYGESEDYPVEQTPELSSSALLLLGMLPVGLAWWRRRKQ